MVVHLLPPPGAKASHAAKLEVTGEERCPASSVEDTVKSHETVAVRRGEDLGPLMQPAAGATMTISVLQTRKMRPREGKPLPQGHTVTEELELRAKSMSEV